MLKRKKTVTKVSRNPHIGSDFDEFLEEDGLREEVTAAAIKRIIALTDSQSEVLLPSPTKKLGRCGPQKRPTEKRTIQN